MPDEILEQRGADVETHRIEKALIQAETSSTPEKALAVLSPIEKEIALYEKKARTDWQKRLVVQYHLERRFQEALASATLVSLLESEDEDVRLRAAKELRAQGHNIAKGSINVDRGVIFTEDPEVAKLREGLKEIQ